MASDLTINKTITINAPASVVWEVLTNLDKIKQWMAEPEMELEIITDWKVGNRIVIKGFHHIKFKNKGLVLQADPNKVLRYNYLSSLSRLPDQPENYTEIGFQLIPDGVHTTLTFTASNFPTETIYHHTFFYWKTTIEILKEFIDKQSIISQTKY